MHFESPWLLAGLLGCLIPVILHLINRQRARIRPFAAVEYLLLSDKRVARRLKLRQLLVLLLRIALVAVLPIALSKPYLEAEATPGSELSDPGAVVLVVDDSSSMQARHPEGPADLMQVAVERAQEAVRSAGSRTAFAVIAAGSPARLLTPGLTYDPTTVQRALERILPTARAGDLQDALREAERVLSQTAETQRRVVVLGDGAAHAWSAVAEPWALNVPPHALALDVREGRPIANRAITAVRVAPAPEVGPGQVRVDVTVANFGDAAVEVPVKVDLGGEVTVSTLHLDPGAEDTISSIERLPPAGSALRGTASLPMDDLALDDTWYFTVDFGGTVPVGVVNGAPRSVPWQDEVFFLRAALAAASGGEGRLHVTWLDARELSPARLEHLDVLVAANVGALESSTRLALESFVRAGGGLLITAGDQLSAEASKTWGDLLPLPLRRVQEIVHPADARAELSVLRLDDVDYEHPVLREFGAVDEVSLLKARTWTLALCDAARRPEAKVLASFSGGQPALVEGALGGGRTMMLTTSVDRDWSDLAIRTSFLPLVEQTLLYLAGKLDTRAGQGHTVGEVVATRAPEGQGPLVLERPDATEITLEAPGEEEAGRVQLGELDLPGHYTLRRKLGSSEPVVFAVNADRRESDLRTVDPLRITDLLERPGQGSAPPPQVAEAVASAEAEAPLESRRTRIWPWLLVGLFWLLLSEAWLVIRG